MLSAVSGRNNSIVSLIVDVPIVILNSIVLFELIGSLINSCSRSSMRKLPSTRRENCLLHNFNDKSLCHAIISNVTSPLSSAGGKQRENIAINIALKIKKNQL